MDNTLVPEIYRQRLVIEGITGTHMYKHWKSKVGIHRYIRNLTRILDMHTLFGPRVTRMGETIDKEKQAGYEGLTVWAESGMQLYTWEKYHLITIDIFSCKPFDVKEVIDFTTKAFKFETIRFFEV